MSDILPVTLTIFTIIYLVIRVIFDEVTYREARHQLGNYILETTKVFRYGIASHYLKKDSKNNVWTVVASFDLKLNTLDRTLRVGKMKLDMKFMAIWNCPNTLQKNRILLTNHAVMQKEQLMRLSPFSKLFDKTTVF